MSNDECRSEKLLRFDIHYSIEVGFWERLHLRSKLAAMIPKTLLTGCLRSQKKIITKASSGQV
jgi:hypothetical protein